MALLGHPGESHEGRARGDGVTDGAHTDRASDTISGTIPDGGPERGATGPLGRLRVVPATEPAAIRRLGEVVGGSEELAALRPALFITSPEGYASAERNLADLERELVELERESGQRAAVVIETSGSTGHPKRVALTRAALRDSAAMTAQHLGVAQRAQTWVNSALPLNYVAGLQVWSRALVSGGAVVSGERALQGRFDPAEFVSMSAVAADRSSAAFASLVPEQLRRVVELVEGAGARFPALAGVLVGGQAVPDDLVERAAAVGLRVVRTYGSSETAGGCVYDGELLPEVAAREVDGELWLSGPMLAIGYLGVREGSPLVGRFVDDDGERWFRTGDLGRIDDDDRIAVTGRADDTIVSGGTKVALGEVERAVRVVRGLAAGVVVRGEDARWGHTPVLALPAAAVTEIGGRDAALELANAAIADAFGEGLPAKAARVRRLLVVDELPVLASGKPDRRSLERTANERG